MIELVIGQLMASAAAALSPASSSSVAVLVTARFSIACLALAERLERGATELTALGLSLEKPVMMMTQWWGYATSRYS